MFFKPIIINACHLFDETTLHTLSLFLLFMKTEGFHMTVIDELHWKPYGLHRSLGSFIRNITMSMFEGRKTPIICLDEEKRGESVFITKFELRMVFSPSWMMHCMWLAFKAQVSSYEAYFKHTVFSSKWSAHFNATSYLGFMLHLRYLVSRKFGGSLD